MQNIDAQIPLDAIRQFLSCVTPNPWLEEALANQSLLLIDHANCEKKAAATAMNLMYRHTLKPDLLTKMSQLARDELLHFQQVVEIMTAREISYIRLGPSRYASSLRSLIRQPAREQLVDTLLVGAFIEARSCERFASLAPLLDDELQRFYSGLLKSESRHFEDYLSLASQYADEELTPRLKIFADKEEQLITSPDKDFRFLSGTPASAS